MFLVARFLNGMAVGALDTSIPVFQSEISPAQQRGRMVGAHGVLIVIGYSMAGFCGFGTYFATPTVSWRLCLSLQLVAPLLLLIGSPVCVILLLIWCADTNIFAIQDPTISALAH